jgi:RNA polymerase sigma-70 factor (ECF subfamily)
MILKHRTAIYGFIIAHLADVVSAEDVFQEVCLVLWEQWERYDPERDFGRWARGIARNKILQYLDRRGRDRSVALVDPELFELLVEHPSWDRDDSAEKEALGRCIERLGRRAKEILRLKYGEGLSGKEIARRLRLRVNSVFVSIMRARASLMDCIEERLMRLQNGEA